MRRRRLFKRSSRPVEVSVDSGNGNVRNVRSRLARSRNTISQQCEEEEVVSSMTTQMDLEADEASLTKVSNERMTCNGRKMIVNDNMFETNVKKKAKTSIPSKEVVSVTPISVTPEKRRSSRKRKVYTHVELEDEAIFDNDECVDEIFPFHSLENDSKKVESNEMNEQHVETWCWCRGIDDGSMMVECSGPNCNYRWFHAKCVHFFDCNFEQSEEWLCPECEQNDEAWCNSIITNHVHRLVDIVAGPEERRAVGLALADIIFAVHKQPENKMKPFRVPDRAQHMAIRASVLSCLAHIISKIADDHRNYRDNTSITFCSTRELSLDEEEKQRLSSVKRKMNGINPILISPNGHKLWFCPDFYANSLIHWYEERAQAKDRIQAAKAAAQAKEAVLFAKKRTKKKKMKAAVAICPPLPPGPVTIGQTAMIDSIFEFALKREDLRLVKESGASWPWTCDPILCKFKFTNIRREYDRVTMWLRENWGKKYAQASPTIILLNCAIFRVFGTIAFAQQIGWTHELNANISVLSEQLVQAATQVWYRGLHAFTRAYCRPRFNSEVIKSLDESPSAPPIKAYRQAAARISSLAAVLLAPNNFFPHDGAKTISWRDLATKLRNVKGFGGTGFVAKECMLDAMGWKPFKDIVQDLDNWTLAGPGARRGLNRLHGRDLDFGILAPAHSQCESLFIQEIFLLSREFQARRTTNQAQSVLPHLTIHDIQFILCEFDKPRRAQVRASCALAKYLPLQGTHFDTPDGKPPSHISCRHPDFEIHSPLFASRIYGTSHLRDTEETF